MLLDRDSDGRADIYEDANLDGVVNSGESDPLNPDMDSETVLDGFDNCLLVTNKTQCDGDMDGYGNHCDADFNNDLIINNFDVGLFKAGLGTADSVTDLNCDGITNNFDVGPFKSMLGMPPGPSGRAP